MIYDIDSKAFKRFLKPPAQFELVNKHRYDQIFQNCIILLTALDTSESLSTIQKADLISMITDFILPGPFSVKPDHSLWFVRINGALKVKQHPMLFYVLSFMAKLQRWPDHIEVTRKLIELSATLSPLRMLVDKNSPCRLKASFARRYRKCDFCNTVMIDWKSCPCKEVYVCNKECFKKIWRTHKTSC